MLRSMPCRRADLDSPSFLAWADRLRPAWDLTHTGVPTLHHRKLWEWIYIAQALDERGMLAPGRRGLCFGVGNEPLPALFASMGCEIVATDLASPAAAAGGWVSTGQHAADLSTLNEAGLCDPRAFGDRVTFREVDMNAIPADLRGFDFTWSSCAIEHVGSISRSQEFLLTQMACLRPGGVAVHTTELNLTSKVRTVDLDHTVLFRERDVTWVADRLQRAHHRIDVDLDPGDEPDDRHIDVPPYSNTHLKVRLSPYVSTSFGFVIEKNPYANDGDDDLDRDRIRRAHHLLGEARLVADPWRARWDEQFEQRRASIERAIAKARPRLGAIRRKVRSRW